ncbi:hypothetical protein C8J57DRAFT_1484274 [Mycena rebaudengoi]|nr:hypothetical protein C8J57DRAFT_1484274 [Mycena rebaudengoi]
MTIHDVSFFSSLARPFLAISNMDNNASVPPPKKCSQSKCKTMLPYGYGTKSCQSCRDKDKARKKRKRENENENNGESEASKRARVELENIDPSLKTLPVPSGGPDAEMDDGEDEEDHNGHEATLYTDSQELFTALRQAFHTTKDVEFHGTYHLAQDPLVSNKQRVQMTTYEIWKVTGYRFRAKENRTLKKGHHTRLWCCQDANRKQKSRPSEREGAKPRDTLGMKRYPCQSSLNISCCNDGSKTAVRIRLHHHESHVHYYDVALPPQAVAIIREKLEWSTPNEMVTSNQIHRAWSQMSEMLWKCDTLQLPSAETLLCEYGDEVEVLDVQPAEGVEQLAWVMKKIAEPLRGKIVEIGIDATCAQCLPVPFNTDS